MEGARRRWWILAALGSALGIVLLDEVLVAIALPTIRDQLGLSQVGAQWVVNAYVLALTACVAATGRLGDLLGHRPVFLAGAAVFALGSLGAGLSGSGATLIASRAVEGVGAATLLSLSMAMTGIAFGAGERGTAVGIYGVIAAVPAAAAPLVGGVLTELVSWRGVFLINVPLVAAVAAVVALLWRKPGEDEAADAEPGAGEAGAAVSARPRTGFDRRGFALLLAFLVPLVLAIMQAPEWGWASPPVLALFGAAALALMGFVWAERRAGDPLLDFDLIRPPGVIGANLIIFCAQFAKLAMLVYGALYFQDRLGLSALETGIVMLAALVPHLFTAAWAGSLTDRHGARLPILAGTAAMVVALAWLAAFVSVESYPLLLPGLVLWGIALPFLINPSYTVILNSVAAVHRGEASGVTSMGRQLGGMLAVALLGAVLVAGGGFAAVFASTAALTVVAWSVAFLVIERPRPAIELGTT